MAMQLKSSTAGRAACLRPQSASRRASVRVRADKCLIVSTKGGGHAFISYYLARELVNKGHDVTIFQQGEEAKIASKDPFKQYGSVRGLKVHYGSTTDYSTYPEGPFDVVYDNNGKDMDSCKMLIDAAKGMCKHYVFVASAGAYKANNIEPMHFEGDERKSSAGHVAVERYLESEGLPFTVFQPLYIYGAHTAKDCEQWFIDRIIRDRPVCIPTPGVQLVTLSHVEDVASMLAAVPGNPAAIRQYYNVCTVRSGSPAPLPGSFVLELRQDMTYEEVTRALADRLAMLPAEQGATMLRLTQHSPYTHAPQRYPLKWRVVNTLAGMLAQGSALGSGAQRWGAPATLAPSGGAHHPNDVLYYEMLDMPLEQLEQLKTLKVFFHKENGDVASEHVVRLKKDALVAQLLAEVAAQLGAQYEGKQLRLLETHSSKFYKMYSLNEEISNLDDSYWRLRVEVVPPDEQGLEFTPGMDGQHLMRCYHCREDKSTAQQQQQQHGPLNSPFVNSAAQANNNNNNSNSQLLTAGNVLKTATGALPGLGLATNPLQPNADVNNNNNSSSVDPNNGQLPMDTSQPAITGAPNSPAPDQPTQPAQQQPQEPLQGPGVPLSGGSFSAGGTGSLGSVSIFGEPLLVRCGPTDTLGDVVARIQAKLGLPEEELAKWRFALCTARGPSELLGRADSVGQRAARLAPLTSTMTMGDAPYLAMEHEDDKKRRPAASNAHRFTYERPVKIYT